MGTKRLVTDTMRSRIINGRYRPGERLPSGTELRQEFDVSASTAVYAIRALAEEGYVETRQGAGNFVADALTTTKDGQVSIGDSPTKAGRQREVVAALRVEARRLADIADRLENTL